MLSLLVTILVDHGSLQRLLYLLFLLSVHAICDRVVLLPLRQTFSSYRLVIWEYYLLLLAPVGGVQQVLFFALRCHEQLQVHFESSLGHLGVTVELVV